MKEAVRELGPRSGATNRSQGGGLSTVTRNGFVGRAGADGLDGLDDGNQMDLASPADA